MKKHTPENVKQDFYNKYSNVSNYNNLTIKKKSHNRFKRYIK